MVGWTIQNFASSTISPAACLAILAVTRTLAKSLVSSTWVTRPMVTSLYLTRVLPASMPSAALKMMLMVGPSLRMRWTAIPMATTAARTGMIQMTEIRPRFGGTTVACGRRSRSPGSAMMKLPLACGIPDQAGIEGLRREHGQHHHHHEEHDPQAGLHRHQRLELHEGDDERIDEYIEHRPPAYELDQLVDPGTVMAVLDRATLHRHQQVAERSQFAQRDHHARDKHDEGQRPRARRVQENHPAHDGVRLGRPQRGGAQHRQDVRRYVADRRGDHQRPRVLDRVPAAPHEHRAAARAIPRVRTIGRPRQQPAGRAGDQPGASSAQHSRAHRRTPPKAGAQFAPWGGPAALMALPRGRTLCRSPWAAILRRPTR